jgi:hypothetical protein
MRHVNFGIPSGQAIARRMGLPILPPTQLEALTPFGMEKSTPLWYYILKEAEVMEKGLRLGPVGGPIVGEVFIGLLKADETSYLAAEPRWKPVLPSARRGDFRITDLLTFAGVVPRLDGVVAPPTDVAPPLDESTPPTTDVVPPLDEVTPPLE